MTYHTVWLSLNIVRFKETTTQHDLGSNQFSPMWLMWLKFKTLHNLTSGHKLSPVNIAWNMTHPPNNGGWVMWFILDLLTVVFLLDLHLKIHEKSSTWTAFNDTGKVMTQCCSDTICWDKTSWLPFTVLSQQLGGGCYSQVCTFVSVSKHTKVIANKFDVPHNIIPTGTLRSGDNTVSWTYSRLKRGF